MMRDGQRYSLRPVRVWSARHRRGLLKRRGMATRRKQPTRTFANWHRQGFARAVEHYLRECYRKKKRARADDFAQSIDVTPEYASLLGAELVGGLRAYLRKRQPVPALWTLLRAGCVEVRGGRTDAGAGVGRAARDRRQVRGDQAPRARRHGLRLSGHAEAAQPTKPHVLCLLSSVLQFKCQLRPPFPRMSCGVDQPSSTERSPRHDRQTAESSPTHLVF